MLNHPATYLERKEQTWVVAFQEGHHNATGILKSTGAQPLLEYAINGPHTTLWMDAPPEIETVGKILEYGGYPNESVDEHGHTV
jgi:hypothetical protein